ncbi:MAG: ribosome recycling factor [Ignavibacteria bacterium GWA2_55_11]|nr:MAG: ribosome recycling factor [Ignavibacteria bacterium GWA2_55_11]OGU46821.1 MAG: ribosome recycling factor [Ignavibacteria bacterium GWC2_56_12]OGU62754.1 MAG: ribosome recycling factor [Ignavibacteria bacterium RIFCSPHIGHO2_02_FULL_56_12]OGU69771.1 MAG: ribosome recycling factor [Ignavibacteria bacterium RIFCSPLOWO2_02_FULL_55_14]OGU73225.1 MAG: ribosome recycling factor [Ignavibacteria bacterium RIFCSPLOWO2_12_FULL_56_21]HAV23266.1 ribosome recycling factor [Bacteroidota bacterium]
MNAKDIMKNADDRMKKAVEVVRDELTKIRTGKATTALLDSVKVDYYGSHVPLKQVANVSTPDVHTISVQPWEKGTLQAIEKAIQSANLGLNPANDGVAIRVPIPPLTEERRRELVKLVKKFGEEGKIAVRNVRRDAIEHLKKAEKDEHLSEDDRKRSEQETQKLTDKHIKEIDALLALKEKEILEV